MRPARPPRYGGSWRRSPRASPPRAAPYRPGGTVGTGIELPTLIDLPLPPQPRPARPAPSISSSESRSCSWWPSLSHSWLLAEQCPAISPPSRRRAAPFLPARAGATFAVLRFKDLSATGESSWMGHGLPRNDHRSAGDRRADEPRRVSGRPRARSWICASPGWKASPIIDGDSTSDYLIAGWYANARG